MEKVYVFKLSGDASGLLQATAQGAGGLGRVGEAADQANAQLGRVGQGGQRVGAAANTLAAGAARGAQGVGQLGQQSGIAAYQMTNLTAQINDVVVSLAGGQNPLMVFLQQGSQISGIFGGAGNALRAVASILSPMRLLLGGAAASLGTLAFFAAQGWAESNKLRDSLILSGNAAGLTAGRFDQMSERVARASGNTVTASREVLQALVSAGTVGANSIESVATAAAGLQRMTGQSAATIAADFATMSSGVAEWARQHNRAWNFITGEQYAYIRRLEAQGEKEKAAQVVLEALTKRTTEQATQLGTLERAIRSTGEAYDWLKQKLLEVGRADTTQQLLDSTLARLKTAREVAKGGIYAGSAAVTPTTGKAEVERLELLVQSLRENLKLERQASLAQAEAASQNNKEIANQGAAAQSAAAATASSIAQRAAAQAELARERERVDTERAFERNDITAATYTERRIARERAALQAKLQLINAEAAAELQRTPGTPEELAAQQARAIDFETRRLAIKREQVELEGRIAAGELTAVPKSLPATPAQQFSAFERGQQDTVPAYLAARSLAAQESARELVSLNKQLSIDLIQDDRQRGLAQISAEAEALRKKLELDDMYGRERSLRAQAAAEGLGEAERDELLQQAQRTAYERQAVEESYFSWRAMRERQLTESLKPEWQRMLEGWRDNNRLLQESWDNTITASLRAGEDAWVRFATTGKLNIKDLVQTIIAEQARLAYRQAASGTGWLGQLVGAITGAFSGLSVDPSGIGITSGGGSLASVGLGAGRADGGTVKAFGIHPVVERSEPEVLRTRRGTYLLNGSADGYVTPLAMRTPGNVDRAASTSNVYVSVENNSTAAVQTETQTAPNGDQFVRFVINAAADEVDRRLVTGGSTSRAVSAAFGVQRRPPARY